MQHSAEMVTSVDGQAYTSAVVGYDSAYRPTGTSISIPAREGALAGTYTTTSMYNPNGSTATVTLPAIGGTSPGAQPAETLTYGYNALGMPTTLTGATTYVTNTAYDSLGRLGSMGTSDGGVRCPSRRMGPFV